MESEKLSYTYFMKSGILGKGGEKRGNK